MAKRQFDPQTEARLDHADSVVSTTETALEKIDALIGGDLKKLQDLSDSGIHADPTRLTAVSDRLFVAADTIIFLAERARGIALRAQRASGEIAVRATTQIGTPKSDDPTWDEKEVVRIMLEQEVPLNVQDFLDAGFGLDASDDIEERKKLLKRTLLDLRERTARADASGRIVVSGQRRGTRYTWEGDDAAFVDVPQTPYVKTQPEPNAPAAPKPTAPSSPIMPSRPVPTAPKNQERLVQDVQDHLSQGLGEWLKTHDKPIINIAQIIQVSFDGRALDQQEFQALKRYFEQDSRFAYIGGGEYHIVARDMDSEWIDNTEIARARDAIIDKMLSQRRRSASTQAFNGMLRGDVIMLVSAEVVRLEEFLKNDPRVESIADQTIKLKVDDNGQLPKPAADLTRQLHAAGIHSQPSVARRRL